MKARADDRRIFADRVQPNVLAVQESKGLENLLRPDPAAAAGAGQQPFSDSDLFPQTQKQLTLSKPNQESPLAAVEPCLRELITLFKEGKTFGSLIRVPPDLAAQIPVARQSIEAMIAKGGLWEHRAARLLLPLVKQADLLAGAGQAEAFAEADRKRGGQRNGVWFVAIVVRDFDAGGEFALWYDVPKVTAAAMLVRTQALVRSGPFDPIFRTSGGYEDDDLCRRIRLAGYRVGVCGRGRAWHYTASSLVTDASRHHRLREGIRNRTILTLREAGDRRAAHLLRYAAWTLPRNLMRGLLRRPGAHPAGLQLAAHCDLLADWSRVFSTRNDQKEWNDYLASLNWPSS
jgi:hypothetical protein